MKSASERVIRWWPGGGFPQSFLRTNRILVTAPWSYHVSWFRRPRFLQPWGRPKEILFAGPWVGEFGWELMNWQAFLRRIAPRYREVVVCSRRGNEALYEDFCSSYVAHDIQGKANCHLAFSITNPGELRRVLELVPPEADHLPPLKYVPADQQHFIRHGRASRRWRTDVLVHARGKKTAAERNWRRGDWQSLVAEVKKAGLTIGSIGLKAQTLDLADVRDCRDLSLADTFDLLASSRLLIGPSSGPMHLAALCGTPQLVWTDRRTYAMRKSSREKYERWWNPLKTDVVVLDDDGFHPPVETVLLRLREFFDKEGGRPARE